MQELIEEDKIAARGMSEVDADTIRRADTVFPVTAVESRHSLSGACGPRSDAQAVERGRSPNRLVVAV